MADEFEKFLRKYIKKNGERLLEKTIENYIYYIGQYESKFLELQNDIDALIEFMNMQVVRKNNIVIFSAFRAYLKFLGVTKKHPSYSKLEPPQKRATATTNIRSLQSKVMSRAELKLLFDSVDDELRLVFSMLYDTGVRRNEFLNMTWKDVTFNYKSQESGLYGTVSVLGKGGKKRDVYFGKTTYELLKELRPLDEREPDKKLFVFYKSDGKTPVIDQANTLYKLVRKNTKKFLGRELHPHCLRHTKMTHYADSGASLLGISRICGHQSTNTTQIYIKSSTKPAKDTYEQFAKGIDEAEEQ